jgi:energy-coupling factor transport system permease protein
VTPSLYVPSRSWLHALHPVTKLGGFLGLLVSGFLVDDPLALLPLLCGVVGLLGVARATAVLQRFGTILVIGCVFTIVVWSLFFAGVLVPSREGFRFGLATAVRLGTFFTTGLLFLATTRVEEVAYALGRVGVPYKVGFTLTLAFRLVPLFFDAAGTIVQAQRCRGLRLDEGGLVRRLQRFVPVIVPVFVGALRRADRMAMALELRGFNSGRVRTTFLRARPGARDVVAWAVTLLVVAGYVAARAGAFMR